MNDTTLSATEAKKIATIRFGERDDVQLAVSLDRKTTLSIGWFSLGKRGGKQARYAVRLGIQDGCAFGGFCSFVDGTSAVECFNEYAR